MPSELIVGGVGVVVFFGAVIWFGLAAARRVKARAHTETVEEERARLGAGAASSWRIWRLVVLEDTVSVTTAVQDEQRANRATFTATALQTFSSTLEVDGVAHEVVVQSPRSRYLGKAGGHAADSIVVHRGKDLVFEATPFLAGSRKGMRAETPHGVLELVWGPRTARMLWECATIHLAGRQVGEAWLASDGSFKQVLGFDRTAVPEVLVPWIFVVLRAGPYQRNPKALQVAEPLVVKPAVTSPGR